MKLATYGPFTDKFKTKVEKTNKTETWGLWHWGRSLLCPGCISTSMHLIPKQLLYWEFPTGSVNDVNLTSCPQPHCLYIISAPQGFPIFQRYTSAPAGLLPALMTLRAHKGPWLHGGKIIQTESDH